MANEYVPDFGGEVFSRMWRSSHGALALTKGFSMLNLLYPLNVGRSGVIVGGDVRSIEDHMLLLQNVAKQIPR